MAKDQQFNKNAELLMSSCVYSCLCGIKCRISFCVLSMLISGEWLGHDHGDTRSGTKKTH